MGRTAQKSRTRAALIGATRELLRAGVTPTMEAAAKAADVSRTTAYRYFPTLRSLLVAAFPHIGEQSLLGDDPPAEPLARLRIVAENHGRRILEYEHEMRAVLRLSLDPAGMVVLGVPMHRGMRIGWIEDALSPLRGQLPDPELRRLALGIGATLGIEAFVWLCDIAACSREQAVAIMRLNAERILRGALLELPDPA